MTVPDGTAQDVLAWVDNDPARAQEALDYETCQATPRSTLVSKLETIASKEDTAVSETATPTTKDPETPEEVDPNAPPEGNAPGPEPPSGEDLSVDLVDRATVVGPVNMRDPDLDRPDDTYDIVANEARADDDVEESPVDASAVEYFQLASNNGVVVLRFDGNAVLLDTQQALALARDLRGALANVTY